MEYEHYVSSVAGKNFVAIMRAGDFSKERFRHRFSIRIIHGCKDIIELHVMFFVLFFIYLYCMQ